MYYQLFMRKRKIANFPSSKQRFAGLECRQTPLGTGYNGLLNTTRDNRTCKSWSSSSWSAFTNLELNYCRNPDRSDGGPWCYNINDNPRWTYCNVPECCKTFCNYFLTMIYIYLSRIATMFYYHYSKIRQIMTTSWSIKLH